jgi:MPBQ/MSBQ methyltransferase
MRFIQHKTEARWFYRVVSVGYDRWINPLFWTAPMRDRALALARLDDPGLEVVDVGAGTGFATEAIVRTVAPDRVTMLDQSPHQLRRATAKPNLDRCAKLIGDAESLPFPADHFDRYVSAGSIEYWPDPQRAVAEAYRVLRAGGRALIAGPVRPAHPLLRRLAEAWMLFPTEQQYRDWFVRAGFDGVEVVTLAPPWYRSRRGPYAVAVSAFKPAPGLSPLTLAPPSETVRAPMRPAARVRTALRFAAGSLAGALFVPLAAALALRHRLREQRAR